MSKHKTPPGSFHYRMTHKQKNYSTKDFWQPGEPLTEKDLELLKGVKEFFWQNGYPPCRADMPHESVGRLKSRFRTWKNVMLAAGMPFWNDAKSQRNRQEAVEKNKMLQNDETDCGTT